MATRKKLVIPKPVYTCMCCGEEKSISKFYVNKSSPLWRSTDQRVLFCKDCLQTLFTRYCNIYESNRLAIQAICADLGVYFSSKAYQTVSEEYPDFNIGVYLRSTQTPQPTKKTFFTSVLDGELTRGDPDAKSDDEKWSKSDRQNKRFVESVVGYDPFDGCGLSEADRKQAFNILAGYCDNDGVAEDGHKIQSVIQISQIQLQCRKLDELINRELLKTAPDESVIKQLSGTKKQLIDAVSKLAQDNNISSNYNEKSKRGANSLTTKLREMNLAQFEAAELNLYDIKTAAAMKQIADLSNQSIMETLALDAGDYSAMLSEARDRILKYEEIIGKLTEENRNLTNKVTELTSKKRGA